MIVEESTIYYVTIDGDNYTRRGSDIWTKCYGESEEYIYDCKELELKFIQWQFVNKIYKDRITKEHITQINNGEVFVFGSNESGKHDGGAAKTALLWGAKYGQPEGLQGNTYAIPTIGIELSRILSVSEIESYINRFILFAKANPELIFYVTEIGCGIANMKHEQIAPLFADAILLNNIHLPDIFWKILYNMIIHEKLL